MPKQRLTPDDYTRKLVEVFKSQKEAVKRVTQTTPAGDAGTQGGQGFDNPMNAEGDLIVGGESGALTRLGAGTDGQVLTLASGVPAWADATGGTGGTATGKYRMYVLATDGMGGFSFVDDGTGHPVTSLEDIE